MRRIEPHEQGHRYVLVTHVIRDAITEGELNPGDKLPTLTEMREQFGVACMTVRRAVQILTQEKVLVSRPGVGIFVAIAGDIADPRTQLARMRESLVAIEKTMTNRLAELRGEIAALEDQLTIRAAAS